MRQYIGEGLLERRVFYAERGGYLDRADISELVNLNGKAVYGFCYKLTKNREEADDLYQETFLKAMELCHKINKDNNPKGFLIAIAVGIWKNNCRKHIRHQRIAPIKIIDEDMNNDYLLKDDITPEDIIISNELHITVQNAADSLTNKLKLPLYMHYTAEMSNEEIAAALKIPVGTVKSRLHKARLTIKDMLEVYEYEKF